MTFLNNTGLERLWSKITAKLDLKVDKVNGKGLSTNDYTTTEKNKLAGIATGATKTVVDTALSSSSTNPVQNKVVNTAISNLNTLVGDTAVSTQITNAVANKVDKVSGKGLSTNDYTTAEKNKLSGIDTGANKTIVDSVLSTTSTNPVQNKVVNTAISNLNTLVGDKSVSSQISTAIASKADIGHTHTKSEVGLGKVDNTADADKRVKYATSAGSAERVTGIVDIIHGGTGASNAATARKNIGAMAANPNAIDLGQNLSSSSNFGGYIDFHFNGDTSDYTSRIIEEQRGRLHVTGNFDARGWLQCSDGLWIAGGGLYASNNNINIYGTALPSAGIKGRIFFKKA